MTDMLSGRGVTGHFISRAAERIGCTPEEAYELGLWLLDAFKNQRWDLIRFETRVNRNGLRIFRFYHPQTRRNWYAMINTQTSTCITVLPPGFVIPRQNNHRIRLKEIHS